MFDAGRFLERGRLLIGLLVIVPIAVLIAAPLGGSKATPSDQSQWVAQYNAGETTASQILDQFAATGTPAPEGANVPVTSEPGEGEATSPLPATYVAGTAPDKNLAAVLRKAQQRNGGVVGTTTPHSAAVALTLNPNLVFTRQSQIADIRSGAVDARIVDVLTWIANRGNKITITSMRTDHSTCVAGSNPCRVSAHKLGRAVDIAAVNGQACRGDREGLCGRLFEDIVNSLRGTQWQPSQAIYGYDMWPSESWNFAMSNHRDHIHLGY